MDASFRYILSNRGVNSAATYPYRARVSTTLSRIELLTKIEGEKVNTFHIVQSYTQQSSCQFNVSSGVTRINGTVAISQGSETHLQSALANVGPVSVAIDASTRSFRVSEHIQMCTTTAAMNGVYSLHQFYYRGVYRSQLCSSSVLNHALLAVGYGTANQADYWLLKNR